MTNLQERSRPTIVDVAREANVSVTTVSHALTGNRQVSAKSLADVQAAIARLGYVPSSAAKSLQNGRALMIGLVVPDVSDPFFGQLAAGVERYADQHGYGTMISSSIRTASGEGRYFELLRSRALDGLIYVAGETNFDPGLKTLADSYPVVLADELRADLEGIPLISADQRAGGVLAGEHLRELGHRRVAVITGPRSLKTAQDRLEGFLEVFPDAIVADGDYSEEVAYHRTAKLLGSNEPPTAIFTSNDNAALGALDCARDRGIDVPTKLSIIGFDDIPVARRLTPALTTVRQPISLIGQRAAETLLRIIDGHVGDPVATVGVELVIRASTATRPGADLSAG